MTALKTLIKLFAAPQRRVKIGDWGGKGYDIRKDLGGNRA